MRATRREIMQAAACAAGTSALPSFAQDDTSALTERIHADLVRHASFGDKFSGGPGDLATANWIAGRLRDSGYEVDESEFDAPFFVRRAAHLTSGATTVDVIPQAPVVPTSSRGVTAPLSLVEAGEYGELDGRVALIVAPSARHAALFPNRGIGVDVLGAVERGAIAVVIVTTGETGEAIALNCPEEPFVDVPAAVLAPKDADAFVDAAREQRDATLVLDGDATHRPSRNIVARRRRGERWIAISTPRSGWFNCVAERGTGTAAFLEIADWAAQRFPDLSVFLMNTGGHEYFFAGSHRVLDQTPPSPDTEVWVHIGATLAARGAERRDGRLVTLDTADPGRSLMATDAARDAAAEAFRGLSGLEEPQPIRALAGELSTFTGLGHTKAFAVLGLHPWFHTQGDTLERVDARLVVPVLRAHQRAIELIVRGA